MPYNTRIAHLQEIIRDRRLAGAILYYSRDVFYYTGTAQPAYLVIAARSLNESWRKAGWMPSSGACFPATVRAGRWAPNWTC